MPAQPGACSGAIRRCWVCEQKRSHLLEVQKLQTRVRQNSALSCQLRVHRTIWELLSGMACTLGTLGACTPARAMRQLCRTASAPPLRQRARTWRVRQPAPRAKTSGLGSVRRHSCAGSYDSRHMSCMGGSAHRLAIHMPGGLEISVTPQRGNTSGARRSDWLTLLHHRRLCTQLCPCGRRTWSEVIVLTLGTQLLPQHVFSAIVTSSPSCPDIGSAPKARAARQHRWRRIQHLLFEFQCVPCLDSSVALTLLRDDLSRVCSGSVPFLLDPAAAMSCVSPRHVTLQCLDHVAAFLLGVSSTVCTRQPPTASVLARFRLPAWSSVHAWLLRLRTGSDFAPARLLAPAPVLHVSAPVRRGAVADARLGLACCVHLFCSPFFSLSFRKVSFWRRLHMLASGPRIEHAHAYGAGYKILSTP